MSPVLALQSDSWLKDRLRAGVRAGGAHGLVARVEFAPGWRGLRDLVHRFPGSPAFVDPAHPRKKERPDGAAWLARLVPTCPLIRYGRPDRSSPASADRDAAQDAAFVASMTPGVDDGLVSIGSTVLRTADHALVRTLGADLGSVAPAPARRLLERVVRATVFPCTVRALATSLGTSVAMLDRRCRAWRVPRPKRLLSLARIFHVHRLAAWSGRPPGAVALALGYSAYSNYARSVRRELACTSSLVAEQGGPAYVGARLVSIVAGSL